MRENLKVTFFGHRDATGDTLKKELACCIEQLIFLGATEFYLGGRGYFDLMAANVLRSFKPAYPDIRITLVTSDINESFDSNIYDDSIYPPLENVPSKFAIPRRNKWMVEYSDVIIGFVRRNYGGAFSAIQYAKRKKKSIIFL